jgi:hypothetical protein
MWGIFDERFFHFIPRLNYYSHFDAYCIKIYIAVKINYNRGLVINVVKVTDPVLYIQECWPNWYNYICHAMLFSTKAEKVSYLISRWRLKLWNDLLTYLRPLVMLDFITYLHTYLRQLTLYQVSLYMYIWYIRWVNECQHDLYYTIKQLL